MLEEDEYISKLERIIRRDFFPNQKLLHQQLQLLNNSDPTTAQQQTFNSVYLEENKEEEDKDIDQLTLDEFCEKYTSEDNASFSGIMERMKQNYEQKMRSLNKSKSEIKYRTINSNIDDKLLAIEDKQRNQLMFYPNGTEKNRNNINEYAPEKEIKHLNTRFHEKEESEGNHASSVRSEESSGTLWSLDTVSERLLVSTLKRYGHFPRELSDRNENELNQLLSTPSHNLLYGQGRKSSDSINGYSFVFSPEHTSIGDIGAQKGKEKPGNTGPRFKVPETPRRELLSIELASKASKNIKKRTASYNSGKLGSPVNIRGFTPSSTPKQSRERLEALSPAAQKLISSMNRSENRSIFGTTPLLGSFNFTPTPHTHLTDNHRSTSKITSTKRDNLFHDVNDRRKKRKN